MKKFSALVATSLLAASVASAAGAAPSAAALSLKSASVPAASARAGVRTRAKSKQVEASTVLIAVAGLAGAYLFYDQVIDDDDNSDSN